jgi:hypothetical protein
LADINGDGRADYLWVDAITGLTLAWTNEGPIPAGGSAFTWNPRGTVANGNIARGDCINFGNLYGEGRADYIIAEPIANTAEVYFNVCPGGGGVGPVTPNLPTVTAPGPSISKGDCILGTGNGDFTELCSYACAFGYCPSPCTCEDYGISPSPPAVNPYINAIGLDDSALNDLCQYACTRTICPSQCYMSVSDNPATTIPDLSLSLTPYTPVAPVTDYPFVFSDPDAPGIQILVDPFLSPGLDLSSMDSDCEYTAGSLQWSAQLGCIAEESEFLMYSISSDTLSINGRDVKSASKFSFETHPDWHPAGNCTTKECMLVNNAPSDTWTFAGNGTLNNKPHQLHFYHSNGTYGYQATRIRDYELAATKRQSPSVRGPILWGTFATFEVLQTSILPATTSLAYGAAMSILIVAMETLAARGLGSGCMVAMAGKPLAPKNSDGIIYDVYGALDSAQAQAKAITCSDPTKTYPFSVYSNNRTDVLQTSSVDRFLRALDPSLIQYQSKSDDLNMFWTVRVTLEDVVKIEQNNDVCG